MTPDLRMLTAPALVALMTFAGCSGGETKTDGDDVVGDDDDVTGDDDDVTGDDDDDDDTYSTTTSVIEIDAAFMLVQTLFAYDQATGTAVPWEDPNYGPFPVTVAVVIADTSLQTDPNGPTPYNSCVVTISTSSPVPMASWVEDSAAWWGFEMPANAQIDDGCLGVELPAEFGGDAGYHVSKWVWGATLAEIDATLAEQLEAAVSPADWAALEPNLVGGGAYSTSLIGTLNAEGIVGGYGTAYEADANFGIVVDATGVAVSIPAEQVWNGVDLATGVYQITTGGVGPATTLLTP